MKTLRAGVVGLGVGRHHLNRYQANPHAEVVGIADPNPKVLMEMGDKHGVKGRYESLTDMLAAQQLDIVSIATPNVFHKPLAIEALEAGCHVLCEKPMAMNAREAQDMLDVAEARGKRLMINFSYRFQKAVMPLKEEVERGALGDIYHASTLWLRRDGMPKFGGWFGQKKMSGGGPLIDLGVHRLDLALWLMGYPEPESVVGGAYEHLGKARAAAEKKPFDVEDLAAAFIRFKNGASLIVQASWAGHIAEKELMQTRLLGTKGGLFQTNTGGTYDFESTIYTTDASGEKVDRKPVSREQHPETAMDHFVDCIVNDKPHMANGHEGLTVMKLLDAIYASAASGEQVSL